MRDRAFGAVSNKGLRGLWGAGAAHVRRHDPEVSRSDLGKFALRPTMPDHYRTVNRKGARTTRSPLIGLRKYRPCLGTF